MPVKFEIDAGDLKRAVEKLQKLDREMLPNIAKAVNKGIDVGKPHAEQMITGIYNIGSPNLGVKHATPGDLVGEVRSGGSRSLPVSQFDPSASGGPIGQVVSVHIIRGNRRAIVPSSRGPGISGAFMIGDGRVMERRQDSRFPIFPVSTIGIPSMLGSKKVSNPVRDNMREITLAELVRLIFAAMK